MAAELESQPAAVPATQGPSGGRYRRSGPGDLPAAVAAPDLGEVRNPQAYLLKVASHVVLEWRDQQPPAEYVVTVDDQQLTDETSPELEVEATVSQARLEKTLATASPLCAGAPFEAAR